MPFILQGGSSHLPLVYQNDIDHIDFCFVLFGLALVTKKVRNTSNAQAW